MKNSFQSLVESRIEAMPEGAVFVLSDFTDIAEAKTVSKLLTRLLPGHGIEKLRRGLFWKPDREHGTPDLNDVAAALARGNCWTSVPSGDTAKHIVGLDKTSPSVWTYITEGTNRIYRFGDAVISFRHASERFFRSMSDKTALLVQVVKAYGPDKITEDIRGYLRSYFMSNEYPGLIEESKNTTGWIYEAIRSIFGQD